MEETTQENGCSRTGRLGRYLALREKIKSEIDSNAPSRAE